MLHLAFEDHRRPGSGGGSARNKAINSRLSARHDITVVTTRYPGAAPRTEDGVRYVHVGIGWNYWAALLSYFALLPWVTWRRSKDFDLVVEEFAAPLSSMSTIRWSRRPTVAVVQWLNAREKSHQYHLPFFLFENAGVRAHQRFISVSQGIRESLEKGNPTAAVAVVPNGVDPESFGVATRRTNDILFLGRLEIAQKGLDVLLDAYSLIAPDVEGCLVIAGDGPDLAELRRQASALGIASRVRFVGRVSGHAKLELLASARIVAMPSRYETFGMVAVEAQACGTAVVAFDIPCLREVVPAASGRLVHEQSPKAFAEALVSAFWDTDLHAGAESDGRAFARSFSWDQIALSQEDVYLEAVSRAAP